MGFCRGLPVLGSSRLVGFPFKDSCLALREAEQSKVVLVGVRVRVWFRAPDLGKRGLFRAMEIGTGAVLASRGVTLA